MIQSTDERARSLGELQFRFAPHAADGKRIRSLVESTGYFHTAEVAVAVELVDEALAKGCQASGYHFVFAESPAAPREPEMIGYACFGPIACTLSSFDLYWIAVDRRHQRAGVGGKLLHEVERRVREAGGERIYIETSDRPQYATTRAFYQRSGYLLEACFKDFYAPNDDKAVYCKQLRPVSVS